MALLSPLLPDLYRLGFWLSRDSSSAEDLVQDTAYRALTNFDAFQPGTNFKAWVFRILHNRFLDLTRRARHEPRSGDLEEVQGPQAHIEERSERPGFDPRDLEAYEDEIDDAVVGAIRDLPESYRSVFLAYALGDLSYEEIAKGLEIPIGTVMSRLHRARTRLAEELLDFATEQGFLPGPSRKDPP